MWHVSNHDCPQIGFIQKYVLSLFNEEWVAFSFIVSTHKNPNLWSLCFQERQQKEEEDRKQRIQLYVFVLRSIAYPFNAKQPGDMTKRHIKITKEGLEKLRARVEVDLKTSYSKYSNQGL